VCNGALQADNDRDRALARISPRRSRLAPRDARSVCVGDLQLTWKLRWAVELRRQSKQLAAEGDAVDRAADIREPTCVAPEVATGATGKSLREIDEPYEASACGPARSQTEAHIAVFECRIGRQSNGIRRDLRSVANIPDGLHDAPESPSSSSRIPQPS
jgi:hypothetical protein